MESKIIEKALFDWFIFHDSFIKCKFSKNNLDLLPDGQFTQILVNILNNSLIPLNLSIKFDSEIEKIHLQTVKSVSIEQTSFKIE